MKTESEMKRKSDTPNIDHLKDLVHGLSTLLEDPHPGLSTWQMFYGESMEAICEFWRPRTPLADAAPELLEALKAAQRELECPARNTTASSHRRDGSVVISNDTRQAIKSAIAKAEGKEGV
jgi:hypothetical protein